MNVTWWVESLVAGENEELMLEVVTDAPAWWGIGFNSKGDMGGADIVLGKVTDNGHHLFDCHATGRMLPIKDETQDYEVLEAEVANIEGTVYQSMRFKRKLDTCDPQDFNGAAGTARMLWAFPGGSTTSEFPTSAHVSTRRGSLSVQLRGAPEPSALANSTTFEIDFMNTNVSIPEFPDGGSLQGPGTTYWCQTFDISSEKFNNDKHHIVAFKPKINPEHIGRVHHILLYECPELINHEQPEYNGLCYTGADMPDYVDGCNGGKVVLGWAVGAEIQHFPDMAGFPIGGSHARHFLMETHYDNPEGRDAFIDSSGITAVVTDQLRPNDVGVMQTGHQVRPSMVIPPKRSHYNVHGWCSGDCTDQFLSGDIVVFGAQLHAHTTGRRMAARHFRGQEELEPLGIDQTYDFNYQMMTPVMPPRNVSKGDSMLTTCTYETLDRSYVTRGGLSTASEMCLTYLWYYPASNGVNECKSRTSEGETQFFTEEGGCSEPSGGLPWGWTGYEYDNECVGATKQCGDGVVDLDMGEECDDGNRVQGDGCDPYCYAENDLVCYSKQDAPFAKNEYGCQKRTSSPMPANFFESQCNLTMLGDAAAEIMTNVAKILAGEDVAVGKCVNGLSSCDKNSENHSPECVAFLTQLSRTLTCCGEGDIATPLDSFSRYFDSILMGYCNAPLPLETGCDFCGDGSVHPLEEMEQCDDGNMDDGDGCSSTCKIEPEMDCFNANGYSICGSTRTGTELSQAPRFATLSLSLLAVFVGFWLGF